MSTHDHHGGALPAHPETATLEGKNKVLGFWLFLGGETILFGTLFSTFIALRHQVLDGKTGEELFNLGIVAAATILLLTSSLFSVLAVQSMNRQNVKGIQFWLLITILFGAGFLGLEIYEFINYVKEGHTIQANAFGSSFFALVGFHGAHVAFGLLWIGLLIAQLAKKGLTTVTAPKVYVASLYWHFIDVVWVFIFTVVYLMGKVG